MSVRPPHLSRPRATPASGDVDVALQQMREDGHERVAIWGAGDHTRRSLGALYDSPVDIACLVDESPDWIGRRVLGWRVESVESLLARQDISAVLVSSRYAPHVERMWAQRERFEAAGKMLYRLSATGDAAPASDLARPPVLAITMPKSGTWLLMRLLTLAGFDAYRGQPALYRLASSLARSRAGVDIDGDDPTIDAMTLFELLPAGQVATLHQARIVDSGVVQRFVATGQAKIVLLVRDPRDIVVARAHFWKHPDNRRHAALRDLSVRDVMNRVIVGGDGFAGINELMLDYRLLWSSPHVYALRFEDLVRAARAPTDSTATRCVRDLLSHVGLHDPTDARIRSIMSNLDIRPYPGRSRVVDEWQVEFGPEQRALFMQSAAESLDVFGYCSSTISI